MMVFMAVVCVLIFALLVMVASVLPQRSSLSKFELKRRGGNGDSAALELQRREELLGDILSIQRIASALLLVVFVLVSVATFGWFGGVIIAALVALEYSAIARMSFLMKRTQKWYEKYESPLLEFVEKHANLFGLIRIATPKIPSKQLDSREELQHIVEQSGVLLSNDEKKLILRSLQFDAQLVKTVMTPRSAIDSVQHDELLGPLVLDDLHKTGRSRFPVIGEDIDHIVGMLYIQNLFTLDVRRSMTVEKAMEPRVFYIREDQTLQHALAAFLRTHHHLFIVVNEFRETVGLVSLEDVIEALLGRKIIDEFDTHDDLQTVAMRAQSNNNVGSGRDV